MKSIFTAITLLLSVTLIAQKSMQNTAIKYFSDGELIKAYEAISKTEQDEKTGMDPKTYFYKGQILLKMSTSPDVEQRTFVDEPFDKGIQAWKKSLKLDEKERWSDEIKGTIALQRKFLLDSAGSSYNSKNYEIASQMFAFAAKLYEVYDTPDSSSIFNAALAAENAAVTTDDAAKKAELYDLAAEYYQKAFDINFEAESSVLSLVRVYTNNEKDDKKLQAIEMGLKKFPNNQGLIIENLNYYLQREKYDEAAANLEKAISNDPNNEILHYALGVAYDNMGDKAKAATSYKKALEIKADYFDAAYNLGAMVYNEGVELNNQANELDYKTKGKEIEALNNKANEKFKEAVILLEKAHDLDPEDKSTIQSLTQIYVRLKMNDKYKEMKAKL
ncbi:MAG: tetratricopeptide repeat protein [Luteibaculum sp.]